MTDSRKKPSAKKGKPPKNTPPQKTNYYEKIIQWAYGHLFLVVIILIVGILLILKDLGSVKDYFFPYKKMVTTLENKNIESGIFDTINIKISVSVISEKTFQFNDGVLNLKLYIKEEDKYKEVKVEDYFLGDFTQKLPYFDNTTNKAEVLFKLRSKSLGNFLFIITTNSKESRLKSKDSVKVIIRNYNPQKLVNKSNGIPTYILRDSIVDVSPNLISELSKFRIILQKEAENSYLSKAELILHQEYLGVYGGMYHQIRKPISDIISISEADSKLSKAKKEFEKYDTETWVLREYLNHDDIIPIGNNFYTISIINQNQILIKQLKIKPEIIVNEAWVDIKNSNSKKWNLKDYDINFITRFSGGASGRNLSFVLSIFDREFEYIDQLENTGEEPKNDFPFFIEYHKKDGTIIFLKFLLTDNDLLAIYRYSIPKRT